MRLTYTDIKKAHFRNIGKRNQFSDAGLLEDFQYSLGQRYQMIMGSLSSYINQDTETASTVAAQQYYYYPVGTVGIDSATITIGSMKYTLTPIYDQESWNILNALPYQPTAIPRFIFARKSDFGVFPIPQAVYTITFQRFFRDRNLLVDDETGGTALVTNDSTTVVGVVTAFTAAMAGRWFTVTGTSTPGQGYWYRIASVTDTTHLELETFWAAATTAGASYRIGESPEIPEEGHIILPAGTAADFYAGLRNENVNATWWNNVFWTGDGNNDIRDMDSNNVTGGLIGLIKRYKDRDRDNIVHRQPRLYSPLSTLFATIS